MALYFDETFPDHPAHTLGGIALPVNVQWVDRQQDPLVGQQIQRSLSGNIDIYEIPITKGQNINLDITFDNDSMLMEAKYDLFRALAVQLNTTHVLSWGTYTPGTDTWANTDYNVIFRHSDSPALDFEVIDQGAIAYDGGYYEGRIKLLLV